MNKNEIAIAVGVVTIVVLSAKLESTRRRLNDTIDKHNKLVAWSKTAQRLMRETSIEHPDKIHQLSKELTTDINFYNIMEAEGLL